VTSGKGKAHGGGDRQGKADVEGGLARRLLRPHVADGIERIGDPQAGGNRREKHAERLDGESDRQPGQDLDERKSRAPASHHIGEQEEDRSKERDGADHGHRFAEVRPVMEKRDQRGGRSRRDQGEREESGAGHRRPARSAVAALPARPAVNSVSMPK
jgi:hypothetical protein